MLVFNPHVAGESARSDRQEALSPRHTSRRASDSDGIDRFRYGAGHIQFLAAE